MEYNLTTLHPVLPEIFLLSAACLVLVVDLFLSQRTRLVTYGLTLASLLGAVAVTVWVSNGETQILFDGSYVRDPVSDMVKIGLLIVTLFAVVYAKDYLVQQDIYRGEYFMLVLFATLGMMIMASAYSFLTVYLGLELLALSLYSLVPFNRDSQQGSEAGMKYFVLGALASGMLLYGISMLSGWLQKSATHWCSVGQYILQKSHFPTVHSKW
jgi:NADH-quinone oxidoreductase subunit N